MPGIPGHVGDNFLRPVYEDLHALTERSIPKTKQAYFSEINLSERIRLCLRWWMDALTLSLAKQS